MVGGAPPADREMTDLPTLSTVGASCGIKFSFGVPPVQEKCGETGECHHGATEMLQALGQMAHEERLGQQGWFGWGKGARGSSLHIHMK